MNLRHVRFFVAVYEEGSFTAAAERENATQSGVSTQIKDFESRLGVTLFERGPSGVAPTAAGRRFYPRAAALLRDARRFEADARAFGREITGEARAGLMPSFTRSVLAPALEAAMDRAPLAEFHVVEAYSGALTDAVARGALDFAMTPRGDAPAGVATRPIGVDQEFLVLSAEAGRAPMAPVRLAEIADLRLILPTEKNARRPKLDAFFARAGVRVARVLELDAMMGTLDLVARSRWATILPGAIAFADRDGAARTIHPIEDEPLSVEYMRIEPARAPLSPAARILAEAVEAELARLLAAPS